ncbi:M48 family metalloprotease [Candidatus Parcubacteria bacterium]|nr:M48 family metalloprotease [Candidatus Parcubacteria bacterium]
MSFFLVVVIALGWFIGYIYQSPGILYFAIIFALFMNVTAYWFSDKLVLRLHKARPATREVNFDLWNAVENLSITAGLPMPKVYIIDDSAPNAFATGRNATHAVVCVTSGLLTILNKDELEGVIAHELSHIGNRDMLLSTVVVVLAGFISILSHVFLRSRMFGGRRDDKEGGGVLAIVGIVLAILSPIAATLIQLAVSRKREFLADADGVLLTRYPQGLANALRKINAAAQPLRTANQADAHLFIANPFGSMNSVQKLFMTHPPVEERIRALTGSDTI